MSEKKKRSGEEKERRRSSSHRTKENTEDEEVKKKPVKIEKEVEPEPELRKKVSKKEPEEIIVIAPTNVQQQKIYEPHINTMVQEMTTRHPTFLEEHATPMVTETVSKRSLLDEIGESSADTMDITENNGHHVETKENSVFLCNTVQTKYVLKPAIVIVAKDKDHASRLLAHEASQKEWNIRDTTRVVRLGLYERRIITLSIENVVEQEKTLQRNGHEKKLTVFLCTNHDYSPPAGPATVIVESDRSRAMKMLDNSLMQRRLRPNDKMPYTLTELDLSVPSIIVLYNGELRKGPD